MSEKFKFAINVNGSVPYPYVIKDVAFDISATDTEPIVSIEQRRRQ